LANDVVGDAAKGLQAEPRSSRRLAQMKRFTGDQPAFAVLGGSGSEFLRPPGHILDAVMR